MVTIVKKVELEANAESFGQLLESLKTFKGNKNGKDWYGIFPEGQQAIFNQGLYELIDAYQSGKIGLTDISPKIK